MITINGLSYHQEVPSSRILPPNSTLEHKEAGDDWVPEKPLTDREFILLHTTQTALPTTDYRVIKRLEDDWSNYDFSEQDKEGLSEFWGSKMHLSPSPSFTPRNKNTHV